MSKVLTEVDTFTANVTVPEDDDPQSAASVEAAFQALANRTHNLDGRAGTLEDCAVYQINGAAVTKPPLTQLFNKGGFVLGSDEITVPAVGTYLVEVSAKITSADTSNPRTCGFVIKKGATVIGEASSTRFSASASHAVGIAGVAVAIVADVADHIYLSNAFTGDLTVDGNSRLTIRRVA